MRPLFPPSTERTPPRAEQMMEELLQSGVESEPGTLHHATISAVASELDRALSRFLRQDPRPWRADVLREGAAETADQDREEVPLWEMIYGPPEELVPVPVRKYPYDHKAGAYGITGENGRVLDPTEVSRAVETRDGLFVQAGSSLYRLDGEDGEPEEVGIDHTPAAGRCRGAWRRGIRSRIAGNQTYKTKNQKDLKEQKETERLAKYKTATG